MPPPYPRRHASDISVALTLPLSQRDVIGPLIRQETPVLCGTALLCSLQTGWDSGYNITNSGVEMVPSRRGAGRAKGDVKEKTETEPGCLHGCSGPPSEGASACCVGPGVGPASGLLRWALWPRAERPGSGQPPRGWCAGGGGGEVWLRCASPRQLPSCRLWRVLSGVSLPDAPNAWACAQGLAFCF